MIYIVTHQLAEASFPWLSFLLGFYLISLVINTIIAIELRDKFGGGWILLFLVLGGPVTWLIFLISKLW